MTYGPAIVAPSAEPKIFGPFRLDPGSFELWRTEEDCTQRRIPLAPKAFDVLNLLCSHPDRIISPLEIVAALWRQHHVQPDVIKGHMLGIRAALGERPGTPAFVENVRGRGYRFTLRVADAVDHLGPLRNLPPVGRSRELNLLLAMQDAASREGPQIVLVSGEPGIGKSKLVETVVEVAVSRRRNLLVGVGQCVDGCGATDPFHPVLDALSSIAAGPERGKLVALMLDFAPTWLVQMPDLAPPDMFDEVLKRTAQASRSRVLREGVALLHKLAEDAPLILVLEDLQWSDGATFELLRGIVRRRSQAAITVLATCRLSEARASVPALFELRAQLSASRRWQDLALDPIDLLATRTFLEQRAGGHAVPAHVAAAVHTRSGGNPLFMHLIADDAKPRPGATASSYVHLETQTPEAPYEGAVPATLRDAIEMRLRRLPASDLRVLELASLTEPDFHSALNGSIDDADPQRFESVCEHLIQHTDFIRRAGHLPLPDGRTVQTYVFCHALYREVCHGRQTATSLAHRHGAIAAGLQRLFGPQAGPMAASAAAHLLAAADWPQAARALTQASDHDVRRFAYAEAALLLRRALDLLPRLPAAEAVPLRAVLLEKLGMLHAGQYEPQAESVYGKLFAHATTHGLVNAAARACIALIYVQSWTGVDRCLATVERALAISYQQTDPIEQARTRASALIWRLWVSGWNGVDAASARDAMNVVESGGQPLVVAAHRFEFAMLLHMTARHTEAHDVLITSYRHLSAADSLPDGYNLTLATWMLHLGSPWTLALAGHLGAAFTDFDLRIRDLQSNNAYAARTLELYRAWIQVLTGDHAGAADRVASVTQRRSADEQCADLLPAEDRIASIIKGWSLVGQGASAEAIDLLDEAARKFSERPVILDWYWIKALRQALLEACLAAGDLDRATTVSDAHCADTAASQERGFQAMSQAGAARLAAAKGDLHQSAAYIEAALLIVDRYAVPLAAWRVRDVAASLGSNRDRQEAAHATWAACTYALADTLPPEHASRRSLLGALRDRHGAQECG